jgi:glycosyltransferase involved in cell wall biosynthesis
VSAKEWKLLFDGRVLRHRHFSGVENYAASLASQLGDAVDVAMPRWDSRVYQQLWEHTLLPYHARQYDLLFCPANIAPVSLPEKTRLVLTLHDVAFRRFPESFSTAFRRYYEWLVPRNIRRADRIVTVSRTSEREILHYYPKAEGKIRVIHLGVSPLFKPDKTAQKEKQLLYVGSLNERKNIAGVIEAFLSLPQGHGYRLILVGNFSRNFTLSRRTEQALELAEASGDITMMQGVDNRELLRLYNTSRCLVFPSFYEGFGLPPLEAMACGTPVIVSNISAMPEVCGETALYCDPHDVAHIAGKMRQIIEDDSLYARLKMEGLERVKKFSWENAAQEHRKVFEEVSVSGK